MRFLWNLHITMLFLLCLEKDEPEETRVKRTEAKMRSGGSFVPRPQQCLTHPLPSQIIKLNGKWIVLAKGAWPRVSRGA